MQADTEEYLREAAGRGHEMVQQMVQKLSGALIYPDAGNVQTNEKLWDVYASEWGAEAGWVAGMAASNRDTIFRQSSNPFSFLKSKSAQAITRTLCACHARVA